MIDALIFSKDRPAQLSLLLRSIERYAPDLYETISVLWTASSLELAELYLELEGEHRVVDFDRELDFELDTRRWLDTGELELVSFLVDDDVFYRPAPALDALPEPPFSLRGGDYWYPFSVDGNVYRRDAIVRLLEGLSFTNPNELEHAGHEHRFRLPWHLEVGLRPAGPCLVGVPANRVSSSSGVPHMGVELEQLNRDYAAGRRLAVPSYERLPAHAAIPYELEPFAAEVRR